MTAGRSPAAHYNRSLLSQERAVVGSDGGCALPFAGTGGGGGYFAASQRKTYALGLRDVLESTFLPELMNRLAPYPDMEISSQRVARREMESQLAAGKLDFAIDVLLPVSNQTSRAT